MTANTQSTAVVGNGFLALVESPSYSSEPLTLDTIQPVTVKTGPSWGTFSADGREVKVAYIRPEGVISCRSDAGDRFTIIEQIAQLRRTDGAGKGWMIDQIWEREHTPDGQFIERAYSGEGLEYLFE